MTRRADLIIVDEIWMSDSFIVGGQWFQPFYNGLPFGGRKVQL